MPRRRLNHVGPLFAAIFAALFAALLAVFSTAVTAKELAGISTKDQGVTVLAKPVNVAADAKSWTFELRFDTHTQELTDDLVRTSVLIDDAGKQFAPLAWEGMAPGAHHRKGVLSFAPIKPLPAAVELRIQRAGENAPRSFRWPLK